MKRMIKFISTILAIALLLSCLPLNSFASEHEANIAINESAHGGVEDHINIEIQEKNEIVDNTVIGGIQEILSLREENVKHFRLSDGTYDAIVYSYPVHRLDKDGVWQDIDNSLELMDEGVSQRYETADSRLTFAASYKANSELFSLNENGYCISMMLLDNTLSLKTSCLGEPQEVITSEPVVTNTNNFSGIRVFGSAEDAIKNDSKSSIVYSDVKTNTDIEYILQGNDIKENIIVNARDSKYEYEFQLDLIRLRAEMDEEGNIKLYDSCSGQQKYTIPAPYMYDNNGNFSPAVSYELGWIKEGKYYLKISADANWINSPDRAFPVIIDPSINSNNTVWDAYTESTHPDTNYGYDEELWVSNYRTTYLYMDIPNLPSGATINDGFLYTSFYYNTALG